MTPDEIERRANQVARLLPEVFQRSALAGTPLRALIEVMALLPAPAEEALGRVDPLFSPYRAPERFLPMLARWVDMDRIAGGHRGDLGPTAWGTPSPSVDPGNLRELIARAARLSQWRGTAEGLVRFLEAATGRVGFAIEEQVPDRDGVPRPFHILVRAPESAREQRGLIERIIEREKPAYVTHAVAFGPATAGEPDVERTGGNP